MLDKRSSERLNALRFPLMVAVVFIHSDSTCVHFSNTSIGVIHSGWLSACVRRLISGELAATAVPLFFLMSGYFFFLGFQWSVDAYKRKLASRVHTLLIPYVFWNVATLLVVMIGQSLPSTRSYFAAGSTPIHSYQACDYCSALLGIGRLPISYQFWFIRDLMLLVLLAPALQLMLKKIPRLFLCGLFVLWFFEATTMNTKSSTALFFFSTGAFLALSGQSLFKADRFGMAILLSYAALLLAVFLTMGHACNGYVHRAGLLIGMAGALCATGHAMENQTIRCFLKWAAGCSFFLYAIHEPVLTITRKFFYKVLSPDTDAMVLVLYLSIPLFVITAAMGIHLLLKSHFPTILNLISGGRAARDK